TLKRQEGTMIVCYADASGRCQGRAQRDTADTASALFPGGSPVLCTCRERGPSLGQEFEQGSPKQGDPGQEDDPARVRVRDEHVLAICLPGIGIVSDEDDDNPS